MWGARNSIFVNGEEIEENQFLYNVIFPFFPENIANELREYLDKN